jgi:hypothetical protein
VMAAWIAVAVAIMLTVLSRRLLLRRWLRR